MNLNFLSYFVPIKKLVETLYCKNQNISMYEKMRLQRKKVWVGLGRAPPTAHPLFQIKDYFKYYKTIQQFYHAETEEEEPILLKHQIEQLNDFTVVHKGCC